MAEFASLIEPEMAGQRVIRSMEIEIDWLYENRSPESPYTKKVIQEESEQCFNEMAWLIYLKRTFPKRYVPKELVSNINVGSRMHNGLAVYYTERFIEKGEKPPKQVIDALMLGPDLRTINRVACELPLNEDQLAIALARVPEYSQAIKEYQTMLSFNPIVPPAAVKGRKVSWFSLFHLKGFGRHFPNSFPGGKGDYTFITNAQLKAKTLGDSWKDVLYNQPDLPIIACDLPQNPS